MRKKHIPFHSTSERKNNLSQSGKIRIIGGRFRRRILHFPGITGLRPTPDRVRETLFNWLGQTLENYRILDLFAGSGSLSFEALSRGATEIFAIESHPLAAQSLKNNLETIQAAYPNTSGTMKFTILQQNTKIALSKLPERYFNLIFADPPFDEANTWLPFILANAERLLLPDGFLYLESPQTLEPTSPWKTYRSAIAGQVCYHLWQYNHQPSTVDSAAVS